eukprot:gene5787-5994_t
MSLRINASMVQGVRKASVPSIPTRAVFKPVSRRAIRATPASPSLAATTSRNVVVCAQLEHDTSAAMDFDTSQGRLISTTEVAAFIQRDDMMDQMYRWSLIEAAESGFRNFGMPMTVDPFYLGDVLWGYKVGIYCDGEKLTDLSINFDNLATQKHEYIGRGDDGFPVGEGRVNEILGKNIEIWKLDQVPVSEDLRSAIKAYCNGFAQAMNRYYAFGSVFVGFAQAMNRYYAFGSVFVDDAQ